MKTIEEIAETVFAQVEADTYLDEDGRDRSIVERAVALALEADRAERRTELVMVALHIRCGSPTSHHDVTPGYFAVCPKCDEDLYRFEVRFVDQREIDIATLVAASTSYADSIIENMESMREDDDDRITDQAEYNEIFAAINRLTGTKEA